MIKNRSSHLLMYSWVAAALINATLASTSGCREQCYDREVISKIGEFRTKEEGLKASIPKLAILVERCPKTTVFRVMWVGTGNYPNGPDRHSLLYYRTDKMIGYEDDFLSGISGEPYYAKDSDVRAVAEKQGILSDFTPYERRPR